MGAKRFQEALEPVDRPPVRHEELGLARKAMAVAQLGETESALQSLSEAMARGCRDFGSPRTDPTLDPLRRDPRSARLLSGHGALSPDIATDGVSP
jgi:hypothetical protein